jgi:hypothetical protein
MLRQPERRKQNFLQSVLFVKSTPEMDTKSGVIAEDLLKYPIG